MIKVRIMPKINVVPVAQSGAIVHIPQTNTIVSGDYSKYEGAYAVTPSMDSVELSTADKVLENNIVVNKIPVWEVSNISGGKTVIIGGDLNYG